MAKISRVWIVRLNYPPCTQKKSSLACETTIHAVLGVQATVCYRSMPFDLYKKCM